jgi:hypothetical protein
MLIDVSVCEQRDGTGFVQSPPVEVTRIPSVTATSGEFWQVDINRRLSIRFDTLFAVGDFGAAILAAVNDHRRPPDVDVPAAIDDNA